VTSSPREASKARSSTSRATSSERRSAGGEPEQQQRAVAPPAERGVLDRLQQPRERGVEVKRRRAARDRHRAKLAVGL
jgi:hypothetical protein